MAKANMFTASQLMPRTRQPSGGASAAASAPAPYQNAGADRFLWNGNTSMITPDKAAEKIAGTTGGVEAQAQYLLDPRNFNPQVYTGQRVADFSNPQLQGQQSLTNFAQGGAQQISNQASGAIGSALNLAGGSAANYGASLLPYVGQTVGNLTGQQAAGAPYAQQIAQQSGLNPVAHNVATQLSAPQGYQLPGTQQALTQLLSGQPDMNTIAPFISSAGELLKQNLDLNILPQVRDQGIAAGGRGGSRAALTEGVARGLAGQELTRQTGQLGATALTNAQQLQGQTANSLAGLGVQQNLGQQNTALNAGQLALANQGLGLEGLGAAGNLAQSGQNSVGQLGLGAGSLAGNLYNAGAGNQLSALQTALGGIPSALNAGTAPGQILSQVGGQQQGQNQAQLDAQQQQYLEQQWQPLNRLNAFMPYTMLGGAGGSTTPGQTGGQQIGQAIQGGLGGLQAATALNQAGLIGTAANSATGAAASLGPWGWGLGALGAAAGLFG